MLINILAIIIFSTANDRTTGEEFVGGIEAVTTLTNNNNKINLKLITLKTIAN